VHRTTDGNKINCIQSEKRGNLHDDGDDEKESKRLTYSFLSTASPSQILCQIHKSLKHGDGLKQKTPPKPPTKPATV
jgi:hypothetical protein